MQLWLAKPEYHSLRQCLLAEVAVRQAEAANVVIRNADSVRSQAGLDNRASAALVEAARFQTFLDVLEEVSSADFKFQTAEVKVIDKI